MSCIETRSKKRSRLVFFGGNLQRLLLFPVFIFIAFLFQNCAPTWTVLEQNFNTNETSASVQETLLERLGRNGFKNKLIDSSNNNYLYGYGPSIIYHDNRFHMFYCSTGLGIDLGGGSDWDAIRYSSSEDGVNWTPSRVIMRTSNHPKERCSCDPSVVYFNGYYYLFYSGNTLDVQTVMFVARSSTIDGEYAKWSDDGTWKINSTQPAAIISPIHPVTDATARLHPWYGTGQQSVVNVDGTLHSWFTDDTANFPSEQSLRIYYGTSQDGIHWTRTETNVTGTASIDVKYDPKNRLFVMYDLVNGHQESVSIRRLYSKDGTQWGDVDEFCDASCTPDYINNIGISGNREGHLLFPYTIVAFGAPYDLHPGYTNTNPCLNDRCWGRWDIYGGIVKSQGQALEFNDPIGGVTNVTNGMVTGWAYDPNTPETSIDVHVYIDAPAGIGRGEVLRADQASANGPHGFRYNLGSLLSDGKEHRLYFYGINSQENAHNPLLGGGPLIVRPGTQGICSPQRRRIEVSSVNSGTRLDGWAPEKAYDGDNSTAYSSLPLSGINNDRGDHLELRFQTLSDLKDIHLQARVSDSSIAGFPETYRLYTTTTDGSSWELLGTFTQQPSSSGSLNIPGGRFTKGLKIQPVSFKANDPAGPYFQIADLTLIEDVVTCQ